VAVGCTLQIGGSESGREPCSQTQTYDNPATTGMLATARIHAATGTPAVSKGHQQDKEQPQQQKHQQQQDLCGKAIKVARYEARNIAVNVGRDQIFWWPWKVPKWPWFLLGVLVKACRDLATLIKKSLFNSFLMLHTVILQQMVCIERKYLVFSWTKLCGNLQVHAVKVRQKINIQTFGFKYFKFRFDACSIYFGVFNSFNGLKVFGTYSKSPGYWRIFLSKGLQMIENDESQTKKKQYQRLSEIVKNYGNSFTFLHQASKEGEEKKQFETSSWRGRAGGCRDLPWFR
jgi:hypothetical protein